MYCPVCGKWMEEGEEYCPNCGYTLSEHHGDGYYSIPNEYKHCPNCYQALQW